MRNAVMIGLIAVLSMGFLWGSEAADRNEPAHGYGLGRAASEQEIRA